MVRALQLAAFGAWLGLGLGCDTIFGVTVPEQVVPAACGLCIFGQPSPAGCYWAVQLDGVTYPVNARTPEDHDAHGPEGMCTLPREARVAGKLRNGQLFADHFELLPLDPNAPKPSAPPHAHRH